MAWLNEGSPAKSSNPTPKADYLEEVTEEDRTLTQRNDKCNQRNPTWSLPGHLFYALKNTTVYM